MNLGRRSGRLSFMPWRGRTMNYPTCKDIRLRVVSPTVCSPTSLVHSPTYSILVACSNEIALVNFILYVSKFDWLIHITKRKCITTLLQNVAKWTAKGKYYKAWIKLPQIFRRITMEQYPKWIACYLHVILYPYIFMYIFLSFLILVCGKPAK